MLGRHAGPGAVPNPTRVVPSGQVSLTAITTTVHPRYRGLFTARRWVRHIEASLAVAAAIVFCTKSAHVAVGSRARGPRATTHSRESFRGTHMTRIRKTLIAATLAIVAGLFIADANAQQAPPAAAASAPNLLQEVVVTGSRIPVAGNVTATSPTTIVSSQDVRLQGYTDITDVMNQLPQNIIGANADFGNTSSPLTSTGGFSTVDLRGLGPQRTLVLVNA